MTDSFWTGIETKVETQAAEYIPTPYRPIQSFNLVISDALKEENTTYK